MKVTSDEWRVARKNPPPLGQGGDFRGVFGWHPTDIGHPPYPNPSPALGRGSRYSSDRQVPRHSPLVIRHFQFIALNLLALLALETTAFAAEVSIYPPAVQLQGPNATQVLLVNSGQRDITGECSFRIANPAVASVSEAGVVTATADGGTTLTVVCKEGQTAAPLSVVAAGETPNSVL